MRPLRSDVTTRDRTLSEVSTADQSLSVRVVEALAEAQEVPPERLDPPLFEAVDPDALDRIFADEWDVTRDSGRLSFVVGDHEVLVRASGEVTVRPARRNERRLD